ncbi:hypothetical protein HY413_02990 [Candidatus Kaiserbacteria bacterium]|nr:hypothetical protein [Candidatus Kaiserbacteria bacterium]
MIAVFAVIVLLTSAVTAYAQFGAIHSKITSIGCGIISGFSAPCDYETGGPLDEKHTISISPQYGTAVASCELVAAYGACTASCPAGYSRTGCSVAVPASGAIGLSVSPAENGCTCSTPGTGLCLWGSCPHATCYSYCLQVPAQSGSPPVTASEDDGSGPNTPTLASIGQCTVGIPHSITMQSTDPDSDQIRYGVDWNNDGSVDAFVPSSGYVSSDTIQTAIMTHTTSSANTVKVLAEDSGGRSSDWASISFSCTGLAQQSTAQQQTGQCSDNFDNDGDGKVDNNDPDCTTSGGVSEFTFVPPGTTPSLGVPSADLRLSVPSLVGRGKTVQVVWSADNVTSCLPVSGTNGDSFAQLSLGTSFFSLIGGKTSSPITARTTYSLICVDLNGVTRTKTATVDIQPNFRET